MSTEPKTKETERNGRSETLLRPLKGAVAGFLSTVPMTAAMMLMHRLLPEEEQHPLPPRQITMRMAEKADVEKHLDEESERTEATLASHFGYGAAAGALYAPLAGRVPLHPAIKGVAFGVAFWAGSYFGLLPATGVLRPEEEHPSRHALMLAAHLVWGSALGLLVDFLEHRDRDKPL